MISHPRSVAIIGGNGFIGSALSARLAQVKIADGRAPLQVTVPVRRVVNARHLSLLPNVRVVPMTDWNELVAGHDVVINLVGILHDLSGTYPWGRDFQNAHVDIPTKISVACIAQGVPHLIHISAVGASSTGNSAYLRSKSAGEIAVTHPGKLQTTIVRPAVVYGAGDRFINQMASLLRIFPTLLLAEATARLQPVHIYDLVTVLQKAIMGHLALVGKTTVVAGPDIFTLSDVVHEIADAMGKKRYVVPLSPALGDMEAWLLARLPKPLLSPDNLLSLRDPATVVSPEEAGMWAHALGINPVRFRAGLSSLFSLPR